MMWLLTSANDAILVILTFVLQLEFDSNLRRYNLRLWWVEVNGKYFFTAHDCKEYQMYINVSLEALRILFYSYWSFFRLEVCVYYYFYLGYLSSLSRTRNGI